MKVLIADKFSAEKLNELISLGFTCEYDEKLQTESLQAKLEEMQPNILVVRSTKVSQAMMVKGLEMIVRAGSGYDTIDTASASQKGIFVCNCPGKNSIAVAELVMGLIASVDRKIPDNVICLRNKEWDKGLFSKGQGLYGKTIGLIGYGCIGKEIHSRANAFGMKVIALQSSTVITVKQDELFSVTSDRQQLLGNSDYVSISVPSNGNTKDMVDSAFLSQMKVNGCLINSSRAQIVDYQCLLDHLKQNKSFFYATDVFHNEPSKSKDSFDSEMAQLPNVYGTCHIGASTQQSEDQIGQEVFRIITSYKKSGQSLNCVNMTKQKALHKYTLTFSNQSTLFSQIYSQLANHQIVSQEMSAFQGEATVQLMLAIKSKTGNEMQLLQDSLVGLEGVLSCKYTQ